MSSIIHLHGNWWWMVSFSDVCLNYKSTDNISCDCKQRNSILNMLHHWDIHIYSFSEIALFWQWLSCKVMWISSFVSWLHSGKVQFVSKTINMNGNLHWALEIQRSCCSSSDWTLICPVLEQEDVAEVGGETGIILPVARFPTVTVSGLCPHFPFFLQIGSV